MKGEERMDDNILLRVASAQKLKFSEWGDGPDYLRMCIDTRFTNNNEELKRRAGELRSKAQELMIEANECDRMVEADGEVALSKFDRYLADFNKFGRHVFSRVDNIRWLSVRYRISEEDARRAMAHIGDGRGDMVDTE